MSLVEVARIMLNVIENHAGEQMSSDGGGVERTEEGN